jgi:LuxR family transcriptional regulator, maltose regulon positive regulatory protein
MSSKPRPGMPLSPRETQVLALIAQGYSTPQVAAQLGLSPGTVNIYTGRLYTKIDVCSRVGATRVAIRMGL